jgi:hypothetical protein
LPDPWRLGVLEVGLYGAITLYQLGQRLSGSVGEEIRSAASVVFDDTCGTIPLSELIWILLHRPPPPPPPWLSQLSFAGEMLAFAQAGQQESLAAAASRQIGQQIKEFGLQREQSRAVS